MNPPSANRGSSRDGPDFDGGGTQPNSEPWWHVEAEEPASGAGSTAALLGVAVDELLTLAESLHDWGKRAGVGTTARHLAEQVAVGLRAGAEPDPTWCAVCPVCRLATAVGTARPELGDGLADALRMITELAQATLDAVAGGDPDGLS